MARAARSLGLDTTVVPSGAGHDAQAIAGITRAGMVFVPSVDGISHSREEYTTPQDCVNGANVLLSAVLDLDRA